MKPAEEPVGRCVPSHSEVLSMVRMLKAKLSRLMETLDRGGVPVDASLLGRLMECNASLDSILKVHREIPHP